VIVVTADAIVGELGAGGIPMTCGIAANEGTGFVPVGNPMVTEGGGPISVTAAVPVTTAEPVTVALMCNTVSNFSGTVPYSNVDLVASVSR
jgi:hypothetical protein